MPRRKSTVVELPTFRTTQDGVSLVGTHWQLDRHDKKHKLTCELHLANFLPSSSHYSANNSWRITIKKMKSSSGKIGRGWEASVYNNSNSEALVEETIGRGSDRGWLEPVKMLGYFGVVRALKRLGAAFYNKDNFVPIRPFKVKYPWEDPEEPNAKYSPFTYCGPLYDVDTDGMVAMVHHTRTDVRRLVRDTFGANAFITDPDEQGWCDLWHRDNLSHTDRIHIDDWRARLIAGS